MSGFLNYVTSEGWDIEAEGSPAQAIRDLLQLAAGPLGVIQPGLSQNETLQSLAYSPTPFNQSFAPANQSVSDGSFNPLAYANQHGESAPSPIDAGVSQLTEQRIIQFLATLGAWSTPSLME